MGKVVHAVEIAAGGNQANQDRVTVYTATVANVAGSGAGASVVTAITLPAGILPGSLSYNVQVTPSQDAVAFVSGKTATGFNVTLNPRLAANTLAVGTFDLKIEY